MMQCTCKPTVPSPGHSGEEVKTLEPCGYHKLWLEHRLAQALPITGPGAPLVAVAVSLQNKLQIALEALDGAAYWSFAPTMEPMSAKPIREALVKIRGGDGRLDSPFEVPIEAIPMLLTCPACGMRHIDEGAFATELHATHACQECGTVWKPAKVPTVGVRFLPGYGPKEDAHMRNARALFKDRE